MVAAPPHPPFTHLLPVSPAQAARFALIALAKHQALRTHLEAGGTITQEDCERISGYVFAADIFLDQAKRGGH
ncbi:MAG: hypothetical protein V2A73_11820 [Pseudomonadota bacterium]